MQEEVKGHLEKGKEDYKKHADKYRQQGPTYSIGQKIGLSREHLHVQTLPETRLSWPILDVATNQAEMMKDR